MNHWSFDILRQSGLDLWIWVCLAACLVLATHALRGRIWASSRGWAQLILISGGIAGTALILAMPALHSAAVGLVWTFIILSLLSTTFYLNLHNQLGTRRMATLLAMRIITLALLVPMLFEPVLHYLSRPRPERPLIFLVDRSGSMSVPDVQNGPTRIQSVWQTLRPQLPKINDHFIPQFFTFANNVDPLKKPADLANTVADGKSTDIVQAIGKGLAASPRDDAVVVLISDGQDNVAPNVIDAVRDSRRKICTITVGSEQAEPAAMANVAVDNVSCDEDFAVGHESKIVATIKSTALPNRLVDVKFAEVDSTGKPTGSIDISKLVLQPTAKGQDVTFTYKPPTVGVHKLAVWIDPIPGERTTVDNRQEIQGLALDPRIKVLYIEGRVRPEYRYLKRMLEHDPNIEESTLARLQENKFSAANDDSGQQVREIPTTLEQWKKFDVIILGDISSSFITPEQQAQIEQAVLDGSSLLMIGGHDNFGPGNYQNTPIEKALPVQVGPASATQEMNEFIPQLTLEGMGHPAMEGLDGWFMSPDGKTAAHELPTLLGNVVVLKARAGAQVLLMHPGKKQADGSPEIVLAVERYGKGRSAAFTGDTTYRWSLSLRNEGQDSPYNRFWGQLVRWLAGADVKNRQNGAGVTAFLNKSVYQFGETQRIRAMVRDDKGDATNFAQVAMTFTPPNGGPPRQVPMGRAPSGVGMYEIRIPDPTHDLPAQPAGDYTVEVVASKDGKELGRQSLKFSIIPPQDEMMKIAANPTLMKAIAEQTGGFERELAGLPELLDQLIRSDPSAAQEQQKTVPLYSSVRAFFMLAGANPDWPGNVDLPMQGLLVFFLLAGEWILRRKWQLP